MKILNKFIWSKTEPKNKNDVWFDGSVFRIFKEEEWQAFTIPIDVIEKVTEILKNASEVYQEKLEAGYGIIIEDNVISAVTPNYHAEENEDGYIKNRTHYIKGVTITSEGFYDSKSGRILYRDRDITLPEDGSTVQLEIGPPVSACFIKGAKKIQITSPSDWLKLRPIKVVDEVVPLSEMYIPETIARKQELTELSMKVDALDPQNGSKQGIIRQMQTWSQAADKSYSYVMSDIVRGAIPQANMDLFTSAGAVFNEESGYFELNGLTDISYEEMVKIYSDTKSFVRKNDLTVAFRGSSARTNFPIYDVTPSSGDQGLYFEPDLRGILFGSNMECCAVFADTLKDSDTIVSTTMVTDSYKMAYSSQKLKKIIGCINMKNVTYDNQSFYNCFSLEDVFLLNLKISLSIKQSARLSNKSILYMISNSAATSAIEIILHTDAYARAMADVEIMAALEAHPNVSLATV